MIKFNQLVLPLMTDTGELSGQIQSLADDVLNRAAQVQKTHERYFQLVNWLSILLFIVGWWLGLFAKIFGVTGVETDS